MFNQYPYLNLNDFNLDYILKAIKEMRYEVTNFVSINAIKYADPIQWNITSQYEKNTIVIDPVTGTAYISVAPVPAGVALTRPEYWTVVFDLQSFVTKANQNLANNYEEQTTTTATMNTSAGQWVIWGDVLYKALVNITAGDAYVVGSNIERITIEDVIKAIVQEIADEVQAMQDNVDAEVQARQDADGTLQDNIDAEVQARQDAINAEVQARQVADGALSGRIDNEVQARQNADETLSDSIGNLNDLQTSNKDSAVGAINEIVSGLAGLYDTADIRNYGGVADGVTDCTQAFNACMLANNMVYLPNYNNQPYVIGAITLTDGQSVIGQEGTTINTTASELFTIAGNNVNIKDLIINTANNVFYINTAIKALSFIHIENVYSYGATTFIHDNSSASNVYTNLYVDRCAARQHKSYGIDLTKGFAFIIMNNVTIDCVGVVGTQPLFRFRNNAGCQLTRCEAEGGYSDGTHATHGGFVFGDCQAVWLERCMADTVDGSGFAFTNCQYVYMNSCAASLNGGHGIAILSTTCLHFLINNCYIGGRKGMASTAPGAHGIYNFNDYIQVANTNILNMTGYAIADSASGNHNMYRGINISNCDRSFVSSSGGGVVSDIISAIADVPTFGNYKHRMCVANNVLYDSPLGT